jgi:hypothetical protein
VLPPVAARVPRLASRALAPRRAARRRLHPAFLDEDLRDVYCLVFDELDDGSVEYLSLDGSVAGLSLGLASGRPPRTSCCAPMSRPRARAPESA